MLQVLARLAEGPADELRAFWPDNAFARLTARNVTISDETFPDARSFKRAYPGAARRAGAQKPSTWFAAP